MNELIITAPTNNVYQNVLDQVGNTPMVKLNQEFSNEVTCYVKLEGANPTGSVKDRPALALIQGEIKKGNLVKGKRILDASSGSFACAISYFGRILGFPVTVVTGSKLTEDKKHFIKYFGAELISHGNFTVDGNRYCREVLLEKDPDRYCFLDQLHNWNNPKAHYQSTAPEILRDMEDVSAIVFSLGSGGTLNGIVKYFQENKPEVKIIGVCAASKTKIPGTGSFVDGDYITPFIQEVFDKDALDYIAEVQIEKAIDGVQILRNNGFFVGIQTGGVYAGMEEAVKALGVKGKVVMISGDAGWKNMDKLMAI